MENKKKIIVVFTIFTMMLSCINNKTSNSKLEFRYDNKKNEKVLVIPDNYGDTLFISKVIKDKLLENIESSVDIATLDYIHHFKNDSIKINNPYYSKNPFFSYLKDKNFIYFVAKKNGEPILINMGNNYEILGGEYVKIKNKIYWNAIEVNGADINSFKVINVMREESEWEKSVGIDKNFIYNGNSVMSKKVFDNLYFSDTLKSIYYNKLK